MHYYKFNVAGWAKDTSHLSLKEEAIYLRLINFYYDHEKPIPLKTHLVLRKLRMADESETVDIILEEFFTKTKDGWIQNHCEKLIGEYQKMAERNKKNAKLGGRPKINDLAKPSGNPEDNQEETESNPKGIPNYKLETNNQELETNNQDSDFEPSAPPPKKQSLDYDRIKEIFNATLTKASNIVKLTEKRKKLVKKLFDDFELNYEKFESYLTFLNDHPDAQWMFERRIKTDGSGQFWNAQTFEYFVGEKCFLNVKENY
jgi:uncharacterized protein YdaU (DUF1376 family)